MDIVDGLFELLSNGTMQSTQSFIIIGLILWGIHTERKINGLSAEIARLNEIRVKEALQLVECIIENTTAMQNMKEVIHALVNKP